MVQQGDSIPKIALQYGLFPDTIWKHPENQRLQALRQNQNILLPGDRVFIPEKRSKSVSAATDQTHAFRKLGTPALFRLQLFAGEHPRANEEYTLVVDGVTYTGNTDEFGVLTHFVPPQATSGKLLIGTDRQSFELAFGVLDPLNEISGLQKRLNNLGYFCGEPDGILNPATRKALRAFQIRFDLPPSGEPDPATREQLAKIHDTNSTFPPDASA